MVQNLLRFEKGWDLLAVSPDVRRAMFYELASLDRGCPVDKHGVYRGSRNYSSGSWKISERESRRMETNSFGCTSAKGLKTTG